LILANGFFSASEIAIVSARRSRLEQAVLAGERGAKQALALSENPDRFLATVQVGITLIGTFAAAFGGARIGDLLAAWLVTFPALENYAETIALAIVVAGITYFSLILGELVPKRLALQRAERMAMFSAPIMERLAWLARPVVALLTGSVSLVLLLLFQRRAAATPVTEEDIVYLVREGAAGGAVEAHEAQLIRRVFQFTDRQVRSVMTPRTEIVLVDVHTSLPDVLEVFVSSGYSRIPVYEGAIDHIVGVLHANDVLRVLAPLVSPAATGVESDSAIERLMRPPIFVVENQHIDDVLALFRQQQTHMALVIDEYGSVAGLVTLQDVLEELVGEVPEASEVGDKAFVQRDDGSWLVDAMEPYDRVLEIVGIPALVPEEHGGFTTLAGLILARLGRIPSAGDSISVQGFLLEVVDMDGKRIDRVLIRPKGAADRPTDAEQRADNL
jgi:putative hemolysin